MLEKIGSNIFFMPAEDQTDRPIFGVVAGEKRSLVVDSGNSPAHARKFWEKFSHSRIPHPELLVITHWHWDHTFGMTFFNIPVIATEETERALGKIRNLPWDDKSLDNRVEEGMEIEFCAEMIKKEFKDNRDQIKVEIPDIIFPDRIRVNLGSRTCLIEKVGGDHHPGSTVIFIPEERVLFLGDCLGPNLYAPKYHYSTEKFLDLMEKIMGYGAEIYIESHGSPVPGSKLNRELEEYREIALAVEKRGNDEEGVLEILKEKFGRELSLDDREMVEFFLNGLEII